MKTEKKDHGKLIQLIGYDVANRCPFRLPPIESIPISKNLQPLKVWDPLRRSRNKSGQGREMRSPLLDSVGKPERAQLASLLGVEEIVPSEEFGYDSARKAMALPASSLLALEAYCKVFGSEIKGYQASLSTLLQGAKLEAGVDGEEAAHTLVVAHLLNNGLDGIFYNLSLKAETIQRFIVLGISPAEVAAGVANIQKQLIDSIWDGATPVD